LISLTRTINRLDREQKTHQVAVGCCLAVISAVQDYPLDADTEAVERYRKALREIKSQIAESHEPEVLEKCAESLSVVLKDYFKGAAAGKAENEEDLRAIMDALCEASQLLGQQHAVHSEKLRKFTDRLHNSTHETDIRKLRMQIICHVTDLRTIGESSRKESDRALSTLSSQLSEFAKRLDNAELRASRDGLTGLLNRSEGQIRLSRLIQAGPPACALIIDLNSFKKINDSWGHAAGDQVLKNYATGLMAETRPDDLVCRWGGDEFLLVLLCTESVAMEKARILRDRLSAAQKISIPGGRMIEVKVSASIGVTELRDSEPAEEFVARVDAEMYRDKRANKRDVPL
jgi:diguanylate cyclase (GGDEF)-like protein